MIPLLYIPIHGYSAVGPVSGSRSGRGRTSSRPEGVGLGFWSSWIWNTVNFGGGVLPYPTPDIEVVHNLGVLLDSYFLLEEQVASMLGSGAFCINSTCVSIVLISGLGNLAQDHSYLCHLLVGLLQWLLNDSGHFIKIK